MHEAWKPSPRLMDPDITHVRRGLLIEEMLSEYPVKPSDIDSTSHFADAFSNHETEEAARILVQMCQEKGDWNAFSLDDLADFRYRAYGTLGKFNFHGLINPQTSRGIDSSEPFNGGWIVEHRGKLHFTVAFVEKVHASSPVTADSDRYRATP